MAAQLDHLLVPSRDRRASAQLLAQLLGVLWAEQGVGPFSPVYVNDGLTLDFDQADGPLPKLHFCFRVGEEQFDAILGSIAYGSEPGGHVWEILTASYARRPLA